jgi:hypothetical protein
MKKITNILCCIIAITILLSACGKKDNCANCKGYIAINETAVLIWTLDSFKVRFPNNRESDWCKLLEDINGQPLVVNNITIGTLNKSCE